MSPLTVASRPPLPLSPGRQGMVDESTSFKGGLDIVSADDAIAPNRFRRGENGRLTIFGAFMKRGGTQQTAPALVPGHAIQNGETWRQGNGAVTTMAVANGTLFTTPYANFPLPWTQRGAALALSPVVAPVLVPFISALGTEAVFIADGGALNKYQGGVLTTDLAGTPHCTMLAVHNERLWGAGDPAFPDSIFYSALNDGDSLGVGAAGGGQIIVRTFGAEQVVALRSLGTSLMIVHPRGISRLTGYGQSDVTVQPAGITKDVGTVAPLSLYVVDNLLYFVSDRGLYVATEQDVAAIFTPDRPGPLPTFLSTMSAANLAAIRVVLNRATRELLITLPGTGIFVFHTTLQSWSGPWTDGYLAPETTALWEAQNTNGYPIVLRGDADGFVSETDRPGIVRDNVSPSGAGGTIVTMTLRCRRLYAGDPHNATAWRWVSVLAALNGSQSTTVACATDTTTDAHQLEPSVGGTWGFGTWGLGTWGAVNQTSYQEPMAGWGYFVDVTITDSGEALPVFSQVRVQGYRLGRR